MSGAKFEQDPLWSRRGVENLKEEVAVIQRLNPPIYQ
jgi:hypothetical protein